MRSTFSLLTLALALSACSTTTDFVRPEAPVAATYAGQGTAAAAVAAADIGWHDLFSDPRLQTLITTALSNNRDLRLAVLHGEATRTSYGIQSTEHLPTVGANVGTVQERARSTSSEPTVQRQWNAGIGISAYELDLWGRSRALSEAAYARYLASDEGRRAAKVSLVGAVADAYFAECLAVEQMALAQQTLRNWSEHLKLTRQLKQALQNSGLDLAQAEGQVARAEAEVQARRRDADRARNALSLLVGIDVDGLQLPEALALEQQPVPAALVSGLPSDLLLYRPDIRQAEQVLRAAHADVAAARAAFFPQITLTTSVGSASPDLSGLFRGMNRVWSFAPTVTLPLFDGGRLKGELRLSELRQETAVADYERAIQVAFREVSDGLAGADTFTRQIEAQKQVRVHAERREGLAALRHRAGLDGRLEWLDAQRELLAARQALLSLRREAIGNTVALYKALGGGTLRDTPSAP